MITYLLVSEHAFIVQNVINEDAVSKVTVTALATIIVIILQYGTSLVDNSLMEVGQKLALAIIFVVARGQLINGVRIDDWLVLK
jgi:hypothetical protein